MHQFKAKFIVCFISIFKENLKKKKKKSMLKILEDLSFASSMIWKCKHMFRKSNNGTSYSERIAT